MEVRNGTNYNIRVLCNHLSYGFGEQVVIMPCESSSVKAPVICKKGDTASYLELPELVVFCFEKDGFDPQDKKLPEDVVLIDNNSSSVIKYGDLTLTISCIVGKDIL